ncbi:5'-methylthioadenosine nucleosidase [Sinobacterium caligoides]|uniref:5'-methylthioadenosine nucleosidase n=1 Tax=Sinobacterium caligoides TaxID=933926 RepID=A0A3N2E170_9GAMM|nr:hypothetical protein [Sinobacterium caligoides]ROS05767.1 5'-methylthioadenosine nucleosidase [Sinobacterium caligoides]
MNERATQPIAIMFAMRAEAEPFLQQCAAQRLAVDSPLPIELYQATMAGLPLIISVNGKDQRYAVDRIATEAAAVSAYIVLQGYQPSLLISAGTCGAVNPLLQVADVLWVDQPICYHDHRIPLAEFADYGLGRYPVFFDAAIAESLALAGGCLSSGNSLDVCAADLQQLQLLGSDIKEMEAAAIARLCEDFSVPFIALKAVTNPVKVDHDAGAVFEENLARSVQALSGKLYALLQELITREN